MNLASLIDLKHLPSIKFSYRGNEILQEACCKSLSNFFERNVALWKRCSRQYSLPLHARFLFKFIPFSTDVIIDYKSTKQKKWEEASMLHFFFLDPSTVEEYRSEYRNDLGEWFAILNKIEGAEWLITFHSSKAREKKNRGAVIERIKSDFAKFSNRIVEIQDLSNMTTLQSAVQTFLLNSLEDYVTSQENSLHKRNDQFSNPDFDFIAFCRDQISLSRLYESLGIFEQVLALFDELDAMLSSFVLHYSSEELPKWLESSKHVSTTSFGCPLFVAMLKCETFWDDITIVELRYVILANQIVNVIRLYEERLQQTSTSGDISSLSLETEFTIMLLRYSQHCLNAICECMAVFKLPMDSDKMQCWIIAFCLETLQITSLLTEVTHVEQAAQFTCALRWANCQAMSKLNEKWNFIDWGRLTKWFEDGIVRCGEEAIKTSAITEIRQLLSSQQQFSHYMQKYHESSIAVLKHFGWRRKARVVGWELAKFLLASDRAEGAVPYLLNFVSNLISDGSPELLLRETLMFTVNHLEKFPGIHDRELVDFYFILIKLAKTEEEQIKYFEKLLDLTEQRNISKIRLYSNSNQNEAFYFGFNSVSSIIMASPDEEVKIDVEIISNLPKPVKNFSLHCHFNLHVQNESEKPTAGRQPQFECIYSETDGINRFACVWRGSTVVQKEFLQRFCSDVISESHDALVLLNSNTDELKPDVGVYFFDHFELEIGRSLVIRRDWADVREIEIDAICRPICFVLRKPASVKLRSLPRMLTAGVAQHIEFEVSRGSQKLDGSSVLHIASLEDNDLEFWDVSRSKWSNVCNFPLDLSSVESIVIKVHLCKILRNMLNNGEEVKDDPPTCVTQIYVKWMDKEWIFPIDFVSFISIDSRTSLLEERMLFEMVVLRGIDQWLVIPQEAILMRISDDSPRLPAKLLNPKLVDIQPGSRYRLVWILPLNKRKIDEIDDYELWFTYRVKSLNRIVKEEESIYDREYMLVEKFYVPYRAPNYELCVQILSSQPGAVLCRVDNPCDMIVSLRSLTNRLETVIISVDADPRFWTVSERNKILHVKESGLGQISFTVFPKTTGFLPYPFIAVYGGGHKRSSSDVSRISNDSSDWGPRLPTFIRTDGKQVHVLGVFVSATDSSTSSHEKNNRLKGAKNRLTKLFD
ncbi:unnamed protein product [Thelazia callipaeda]|uniref:Bm7049 n=1 Tax=Thelazia callipaeda TaxID=103827 RepID=A0A0N5CY91_THECL|nr:unnamed protein product [Thelazia callipaeda]